MDNASDRNLPQVLTNAVYAIHDRQQHNQNVPNQNNQAAPVHDVHKWRNILSFWILGMCNNYGYAVMLSAAFDILGRFNTIPKMLECLELKLSFAISRQCMVTSTGVLLLADTIPSLTVSLIAPFLPFYIKNVISAWSSGTGAAGLTGALTYAALTSLKFAPKTTMLLMLIVPMIQLITFCVMLEEPNGLWSNLPNVSSSTSLIDQHNAPPNVLRPLTFAEKIDYFPKMLIYVLPLFSVYLCEYLINQGLLDLLYFKKSWLDQPAQYRWLQATYQIGVFVSRSSLSCFSTDQIWIMSIFQFMNVVYFTFQAIFMMVPTISVIFIIVFWEGLLGGCCYVNTFNRISKEVPAQYRLFGLGVTTIGQSLGIVLAGLMAIPMHKWICSLPAPSVLG